MRETRAFPRKLALRILLAGILLCTMMGLGGALLFSHRGRESIDEPQKVTSLSADDLSRERVRALLENIVHAHDDLAGTTFELSPEAVELTAGCALVITRTQWTYTDGVVVKLTRIDLGSSDAEITQVSSSGIRRHRISREIGEGMIRDCIHTSRAQAVTPPFVMWGNFRMGSHDPSYRVVLRGGESRVSEFAI